MDGNATRKPGILNRMLEAQQRERRIILAEVLQVRDLMGLLMKRRNGTRWTRAERKELHGQLRALADLSPYLVILALPGSIVLLPVVSWWLDRRRNQRTIDRMSGDAAPVVKEGKT